MVSRSLLVGLGLGLFLGITAATFASDSANPGESRQPLPEPFTLTAALELIDPSHPDLLAADAGRVRARAERLDAEALTGIDASMRGRLRWVEPNSKASLQQHDDHALTLVVSKRLTDFGVSSARLAASDASGMAADLAHRDAMRARKLAVIRAYFDVIEADLLAAWHTEAMQVQFLRQEDVIEAYDLGETSELDLARADAEYQLALARSYTAEAGQRSTRQALAQSLNRPRQLPSVVLRPDLPLLNRPVPDESFSLTDEAIANNAGLRALNARVQAAQQAMAAARASDGPVLDAQGELGTYSRDLGGADQVRLGLVLSVPLSTGGRTQADIARARADLLDSQAERGRHELSLRESVLEFWQALGLARYQLAEARANMNLRDMELERSRLQFTQEVQSNLGSSMANYTEAEYRLAVAEHDLAVAWLRLDALLGREITLKLDNGPPPATDTASAQASGDPS